MTSLSLNICQQQPFKVHEQAFYFQRYFAGRYFAKKYFAERYFPVEGFCWRVFSVEGFGKIDAMLSFNTPKKFKQCHDSSSKVN